MPVSVPDRDDWFETEHGFPRPNWGAINGWLRVFAPKSEWNAAWEQCTRHWLGRLRSGLGGDYTVAESEHFHLLSEHPPEARAKALVFFEQTRTHIHKVLGEIAPDDRYGKHVVIRFSDNDDYYAYIAYFYPDGTFAESGGVFLKDGYLHIAQPQGWSPEEERRTLVHELTHNLLADSPLPPWLNEALAMAFEADLAGEGHEPLNHELAARHREYWNPTTIQAFWRGESFADVDGQELAYSLSRILLNLIHTEIRLPDGEFRRFLLRADWGDAGAIAAREHLGIELEDLVASFLGPGTWAPRPKTWPRAPQAGESEESPQN